MSDLFSNDPVFKQKKRDSRGRFATAEKALYDKAIKVRGYLEYQVEKYRRVAESSNGAFIALQRIIGNQKRIIASLRKELAETKKLQQNVRFRISKECPLRGQSASS